MAIRVQFELCMQNEFLPNDWVLFDLYCLLIRHVAPLASHHHCLFLLIAVDAHRLTEWNRYFLEPCNYAYYLLAHQELNRNMDQSHHHPHRVSNFVAAILTKNNYKKYVHLRAIIGLGYRFNWLVPLSVQYGYWCVTIHLMNLYLIG